MESLFILVGVAIFLGPIVIAIVALMKVGGLRREIGLLNFSLRRLEGRIEQLQEAGAQPAAGTMDGVGAVVEAQDPTPEASGIPAGEAPEDDSSDELKASESSDDVPEDVVPPEQPVPARPSIEQRFASRWIVWMGTATIALAGIFLVKYASDSGLLGPGVRCVLGVLLGGALAIGGEWVRRHPEHGRFVGGSGSYVTQGLTAAGIFIAFASVYAAYGLYDLLPPLIAFVGLAAVAFLAFALSLLQGPFIALVGIVGGYLTPFLITSSAPSAWSLFAYLAVLGVTAFALLRYRQWWWLSYAIVAGGIAWTMLWLLFEHDPVDALPVGLYLVVLLVSALAFWRGHGREAPGAFTWAQHFDLTSWEWASVIGGIAIAAVLPIYAAASSFTYVAIGVAVVCTAIVAWRALEAFAVELVIVAFAIAAIAVMALWHPPSDGVDFRPFTEGMRLFGPVLAAELVDYVTAALIFAATFGLGGYLAVGRGVRPAIWAGVSVAVPLAIVVLSYYRIAARVPDLNWALIAIVLAVTSSGAVTALRGRAQSAQEVTALGFYAAGAVAALGFAAAMVFEKAMLTVALSVLLPGLAWIGRDLKIPVMRPIAAIVAGVVLVRLILNRNILGYGMTDRFGEHWVLYGYGVPAIAFYLGARLFAEERRDYAVNLLEGGALAFVTLLISMEIRVLVSGSIDAERYGLLEAGLQTLSCLIIAGSRIYRHATSPNVVALWGARVLIAVAMVHVTVWHLFALNPVATGDPVGTIPIVNILFLAYALPAAILTLLALYFPIIGCDRLRLPAFGLAFVAMFTFIVFEVQRMFQGPVLSGWPRSDEEVYAHSAAWLAYSLALLGGGIRFGSQLLRYAALAVLVLTVLKVFLYDMSDLTGLLRVASFLGLGLILVGIGYIYQRFIFPSGGAEARDVAPEDAPS